MSSLPGHTLERYLAWEYDLVVSGLPECNNSLMIAEACKTIEKRPRKTKEQFKEIVELFEDYREQVENSLDSFDEENQGWRGYASYAFDFLPDELHEKALEILGER